MFGFGVLLAVLGCALLLVLTQVPREPETEVVRGHLRRFMIAAFAVAWFLVLLGLLFDR